MNKSNRTQKVELTGLLLKLMVGLLITLNAVELKAQLFKPESLSKLKPEVVEKFTQLDYMSAYLVRTHFAKDSLLNPGVCRAFKDKTIVQVDLVYTDYRASRSFDQPELNKQRFRNLYKVAPELFNNSAINWRVICQTGCATQGTCESYFHGFVVYYNPISFESRAAEILSFTSVFHIEDAIDTVNLMRRTCIDKYYAPKSRKKREMGIRYDNPGFWNRDLVRVYDTAERIRFVPIKKLVLNSDAAAIMKYQPDTSVLAALNRNTDWKDMQIVVDVTGSMSPYLVQLVQWIALKQNIARVDDFVFFQDGDFKPDVSKIMGKTGGIYRIESQDFNEVYQFMQKAMSKGGGGDSPENDVEAILEGVRFNPDAKEIILIADNFSNMRDYQMIKKLNKPVHVIVCGNYGSINTQYLDLAYSSHGSVHTMTDDITELFKLSEGQKIKIGSVTYKISGGRFVPEFGGRI
ncbi:MAG: hypothetical protein GC181_09945 [Bacteroidetes bacterium]|nr:hypothetical protein [Bacteroidota bacterium]